jgi:hypothetical protein
VAVSRAVVSAQSGGEVTLELECAGTEFTNVGTFGSPALQLGPPLLFGQMGLTVGATTNVKCRSFRLTVDNVLNADRFFFGMVTAAPTMMDRVVTVEIEVPYGEHPTLLDAGSPAAGVAVTALFTFGNQSLQLAMPSVRWNITPAPANPPDEMFFTIPGQAFSDTPNGELTAVLDTTA